MWKLLSEILPFSSFFKLFLNNGLSLLYWIGTLSLLIENWLSLLSCYISSRSLDFCYLMTDYSYFLNYDVEITCRVAGKSFIAVFSRDLIAWNTRLEFWEASPNSCTNLMGTLPDYLNAYWFELNLFCFIN